MSEKFKKSYRCYLIDHHSPNPPYVTLDKLDFNEYEKFFKIANVDSIMLYCKDHWGSSYYDSKVEKSYKHPALGDVDFVGAIREITLKNDIEFTAYYCFEYDTGAAWRNSQWRVQKPDGSYVIRDDLFAKWPVDCMQTGYGEYCLSQLEEIISKYKPDALFLDIFGASLCYCPICRDRFKAQYGYEIPESGEGIEQHKKDIIGYLDNNSEELLSNLKARLRAIDESIAVTINFASHYPEKIRKLLDYQFAEPVLQDNWFSSAYTRDTAKGRYPIMMPGEFSAVYNYPSKARYIADLGEILAQGCRVGMYSGSQHIDGTLDMEEAKCIGAAFKEIELMHPHTQDRLPIKYAGIIQSDTSLGINNHTFHQDSILRLKQQEPHVKAVLGAMKLCERAKLPWNVIPEQQATDFSEYKIIILPELYVVSDELKEMLEKFAKQGGTIISSAMTGLYNESLDFTENFALEEIFGIKFKSVNREYEKNAWSAYLKPIANLGGILDGRTTPPISSFFVEADLNGAQALANFIEPCVKCDETHWVNWWSPPPGKEINFPAISKNGNAYYCAFDLFTMAADDSYACADDIFAYFVSGAQEPPIKNILSAPDMVRTAFCQRGNQIIVHQVSQIPKKFNGQVTTISGGRLELNFKAKEAKVVYPYEKRLAINEIDGKQMIELPAMDIAQIIIIE